MFYHFDWYIFHRHSLDIFWSQIKHQDLMKTTSTVLSYFSLSFNVILIYVMNWHWVGDKWSSGVTASMGQFRDIYMPFHVTNAPPCHKKLNVIHDYIGSDIVLFSLASQRLYFVYLKQPSKQYVIGFVFLFNKNWFPEVNTKWCLLVLSRGSMN